MARWAVVGALALSCAAGERSPPDVAPRFAGERDAEARREPFRTVFVDRRPGNLVSEVLGVDGRRGVAYLHHGTATVPHEFDSFDTVDLRGGLRDSWLATDENARKMEAGSYFHAVTGAFEGDLARMAGMAHGAGPNAAWIPTLAVSPDGAHVIYQVFPTDGHDGDWLFAADREGRNGRRIGALSASYDPTFSPDGAYLAWDACPRCCPCDYGLYVAPVSKAGIGEPVRVPGMSDPHDMKWAPVDDVLYAIAGPHTGHRCLYRVDAAAVRATKVACSPRARDGYRLHADPSGAFGVLLSELPGAKDEFEASFVELASGAALASRTLRLDTLGC